MVANKNSNNEANNTVPTIKIGDGGSSVERRRLPGGRSLKRLLSVAFVLVLIIVALFSVLSYRSDPNHKVYAEAAGHKIHKKDIDSIKNGDTSITDQQAATVLADKYLTQAMAKEHNVSVSQNDISAADVSNVSDAKQQRPYAYQNLINQVYFTKLAAENQGAYKGKLLIANFSRYVPFKSAIPPQQKGSNPNLGNPAAIAADKKYAQDFITGLYNQIKTKQISFDQAIQAEHNDPTVGENAYPTQPHSEAFDGPFSQIPALGAASVKSKMASIKPGQLTAPFVVRTANSAYDPKSTAESYLLVIQLDSKSGGGSTMTFPQELAQAKKEFGYKIHV